MIPCIQKGINSLVFPVSKYSFKDEAYAPKCTQNAVQTKLLIAVTVVYYKLVTANTPTT